MYDVLTKAFADKFGFGYLTNGQIQRLRAEKEISKSEQKETM